MVKLPKFMRKLKFESQVALVRMINFTIDGFIRDCEDEEFTDKPLGDWRIMSEEEYAVDYELYITRYKNYIKSRYVNVMPNYVGVTPRPIPEAVFFFKIGDVPNSDILFSDKTLKYWDFADVLLNEFLPNNFPSFRLVPRS